MSRHDVTAWDCDEPYDGPTYRDRSCPACGAVVQVLAKDEGDFYFIATLTRRDVAHRDAVGGGVTIPFDPERVRAYGSLSDAQALAAEHDAELVIT
jgi:hypothetical protein